MAGHADYQGFAEDIVKGGGLVSEHDEGLRERTRLADVLLPRDQKHATHITTRREALAMADRILALKAEATPEPRKGTGMVMEQIVAAHEALDELGIPKGDGTGGEYAYTVATRIRLLAAPAAEPAREPYAWVVEVERDGVWRRWTDAFGEHRFAADAARVLCASGRNSRVTPLYTLATLPAAEPEERERERARERLFLAAQAAFHTASLGDDGRYRVPRVQFLALRDALAGAPPAPGPSGEEREAVDALYVAASDAVDSWLEGELNAGVEAGDAKMNALEEACFAFNQAERLRSSTPSAPIDHVSADGVARDEWGYGVRDADGNLVRATPSAKSEEGA